MPARLNRRGSGDCAANSGTERHALGLPYFRLQKIEQNAEFHAVLSRAAHGGETISAALPAVSIQRAVAVLYSAVSNVLMAQISPVES